jgi:hypothetical protein
MFLARFRTYKIATPPQTKTPAKTTFWNWCLYSSFVHVKPYYFALPGAGTRPCVLPPGGLQGNIGGSRHRGIRLGHS